MQIRLLNFTEHHIIYSMHHCWQPSCSGVKYLQWQYLISLFLNWLPYLKAASIKHMGRYVFSAAHGRGNAPSTPDGKYILHFLSAGRDFNFDGTLQSRNFPLWELIAVPTWGVRVGSRVTASWPQEVCYETRRFITNSRYVKWDI